mmetsp:Transcript_99594/g.297553  ORF Transcript_99594/g.297553 Transcript_99594/m.297553 type:complete len:207 (-) Transcript_99594:192-812(-)
MNIFDARISVLTRSFSGDLAEVRRDLAGMLTRREQSSTVCDDGVQPGTFLQHYGDDILQDRPSCPKDASIDVHELPPPSPTTCRALATPRSTTRPPHTAGRANPTSRSRSTTRGPASRAQSSMMLALRWAILRPAGEGAWPGRFRMPRIPLPTPKVVTFSRTAMLRHAGAEVLYQPRRQMQTLQIWRTGGRGRWPYAVCGFPRQVL